MLPMPVLAPSKPHAGTYPALVLNGDYRPLSLMPLSVWESQDAIKAVVNDRVYVVQEYDRLCRSANLVINFPSVIVLKKFHPAYREPAFTKYNVLLRDRYCCAYCGHQFSGKDLSYDHVIPRAQGGKTTWHNIVMACHKDNGMKGNRTPEQAGMPLLWRPWKPTSADLASVGARFRKDPIPPGWNDFLGGDSV